MQGSLLCSFSVFILFIPRSQGWTGTSPSIEKKGSTEAISQGETIESLSQSDELYSKLPNCAEEERKQGAILTVRLGLVCHAVGAGE